MRKGFRRAQTGSRPHTTVDGKEDREGRSAPLLVSPKPLSGSTMQDWADTQMTCSTWAGRSSLVGNHQCLERVTHYKSIVTLMGYWFYHFYHIRRITEGFKHCSQQNNLYLIREPRA